MTTPQNNRQQLRQFRKPLQMNNAETGEEQQAPLPDTGRQASVPQFPATGPQLVPRLRLRTTGEQSVSLLGLYATSEPNIPTPQSFEEGGWSTPQHGQPASNEQRTSQFQVPAAGWQNVPPQSFAGGQRQLSQYQHPAMNGQSAPSLQAPPVNWQPSAQSPFANFAGQSAPSLQAFTGEQQNPSQPPFAPLAGQSAPSLSAFTAERQNVAQPAGWQSASSLQAAVVDRREVSRPVPSWKGVSSPSTPVVAPRRNSRLEKSMPPLAILFNIVLIVLVVWLVQNHVFLTAPGQQQTASQAQPGSSLKRSLNDITKNKAISPYVFGTNMALFQDDNEPILTSAATRQALKDIGVRIIRMPTRPTLKEATEITAAKAIKEIGAAPLIIINGPEFKGGSILQSDEHTLSLLNPIFGNEPVYYEFGNESDLNGVNAQHYTQVWNQVIPVLKRMFPNARFIAPDMYQFDRRYLKTFLQGAQPLPDGVSWHEYACSVHWTAAACLASLDSWSVHFTQARAAMQEATGKTLPIWISEWNYTSDQQVIDGKPLDDGKYNNPSFMRTWTTNAMNILLENRIFAAMQYFATNQPMPLVNKNNTVGSEGQIFQQEYKQVMVNGYTPPMRSPLPPTPKPTMIPGQSYSFEDGTEGWVSNGGGITPSVSSTAEAFDGTHSLYVRMSNPSEDDFPYVSLGAEQMPKTPKAGQMISVYIYVANKAALMNAKIFVANQTHAWFFSNSLTLTSGRWNRIWYALPMNFNDQVSQVGIQFFTSTPGVPTDVYIDAFNWV